jgi:hypothetical protein
MAISPEQARLGSAWKMTPEEELRLAAVEQELDQNLINAMAGSASERVGLGVGVSDSTLPMGTLSAAMRAALVMRYRAAGWPKVGVTEHPNNYSFQFNI